VTVKQNTGWMIGLSALAMVVLCGGLASAGIYVLARRASAAETEAIADAQEQLRRAAAEQSAAEARAREEQARAEAEMAAAQAEAARARAEAEGASDPLAGPDGAERAGVVRRVVRRVQPRLQGCYEQTLREEPGASVNAEVTLLWNPDGTLVSATVTSLSAEPSTADTPTLRHCLEGAFTGSMVPSGSWELRVSVPLVFHPA
jgi:hypothetical protein